MSTQSQSASASTTATNPLSSGYYGSFYSLTFEVKLKRKTLFYQYADDNDTVYFAHCYPYTYTDLCDMIRKVCTY